MSSPPDKPLPPYPSGRASPGASARPALASAPVTKAPLTKRMRPGHWMAIDYAVGAIAALLALFVVSRSFSGPPRIVAPTSVLLGAVVFFPVALRRCGPVVAYGVLIAAAVVVAGAGIAASIVVFLAAAFVLYLVTATNNRQTGAAALALALAAIGLIVIADKQLRGDGADAAYVAVAFAEVIAWMTGYSVRQRRLYAQTLQHQAASSAVAEERLRIARELHDVVAHSMSVIAVQAGYGQYVIDTSPSDARDALGAIQATARDALEEMRRMLGVLRQQDAEVGGAGRGAAPAPLAPAPGLSDLDRLIQRTCGAGVRVSLERSGLVRAAPAGIDMSAYRIIQEALTNVVKHAGGGAYCSVTLRYGENVLDIQVTDDGGRSPVLAAAGASLGAAGAAGAARAARAAGVLPAGALPAGVVPNAGHGIIGMRERANLCGGVFSARPLPAGGFQVTATLPLLSGAPAPGGSGEAGQAGEAGGDLADFEWDAPGDPGGPG
jgi:signal transduction histidine kinase